MAVSLANGFGLEPSWVRTALKVVPDAPTIFAPQNVQQAMLSFGIGNRKVEALGSWLRAASLCDGTPSTLRLTLLGQLIKDQDPNLEDTGTWLIIHLMLALSADSSGLRHDLWRWYAGKLFPFGFTMESLRTAAAKDFPDSTARTIRSGLDEVVKTLRLTPLGSLGFFQEDTLSGPEHLCKTPSAPGVITHALLLAGVARQLELSGRDTVNFDELIELESGVARALNLPRSSLTAILDGAPSRFGSHLVAITRTAGLDSVWLGERSLLFWLAWHYLGRRNGPRQETETHVRHLLEDYGRLLV